MKTVEEAINWVTSRHGQNRGVEHYKKYIQEKNPRLDELKFIHVAGTNGKGSTCNFLCDCLMSAGYKVGLFTSPHLIAHQDRITVNHQWIKDDFFLKTVQECQKEWEEWELNMFEIDFDIMLRYFTHEKVEIAVIEVGLGGRLDSTNVIEKTLASVIVSIGLDHMERLGDTKEKIAFEKAGIIKPNCVVINGEKETSSKEVIEQVAKEKGASVINLDTIKVIDTNPVEFIYRGLKVKLKTLAQYQVHNAACAIETLFQCRRQELISITDQQIIEGLMKSQWKGRFQTLKQSPLVIVDGAHNEHGIEALVQSLDSLPHPLILVFAALKDKQYPRMIHKLHECADEMIITTFDFYRAASLELLNTESNLVCIPEWKEALEIAETKANKIGTVLVTGSLYFISEVVAYYTNNSKG